MNDNKIDQQRRKAVRNILAGAGVTAGVGALSNKAWVEPMINAVVVPAHAQTSDAELRCCPYYFDATQSWCYDDGGQQNGNTGPLGDFSVYNWVQPDNCPTPNN